MGEAMSEGRVFVHAKARALLEVVRLAFEGSIVFEIDSSISGSATLHGDQQRPVANNHTRAKVKHGKEVVQHQQDHPPPPSRPASSTGSGSRLVPGGPCTWCAVTATPQWRRPRGTNKLLCNACGIFFTRYSRLPEKSHQAYATGNRADSAVLSATNTSPPETITTTITTTDTTTSTAAAATSTEVMPRFVAPLQALGDIAAPEQLSVASAAAFPATSADGHTYSRPARSLHSHQQVKRVHEQQQLHPQPQERLQPQPYRGMGSAPVFIRMNSHKRKEAPQPETALWRGMVDEAEAEERGDCALAATVRAPSSMADETALRAVSEHLPSPNLQNEQLYALAGVDAAAAAAAAEAAAASTDMTVTPLDLDALQDFPGRMQHQLEFLAPVLKGLAGLKPLCLHGVASEVTSPGPAATALEALPLGHQGYPGLRVAPSRQGSGHPPTTCPQGIAVDVLRWRLALPGVGLLPSVGGRGSGAAAVTLMPRPLYARLPKRQRRLPVGESEDSNASTSSQRKHGVATRCANAEISHDEDEGAAATFPATVLTTTTAPPTTNPAPTTAVTITTTTTATASLTRATMSCASVETAAGSVGGDDDRGSGMSCSPLAVLVPRHLPVALQAQSTAKCPSLGSGSSLSSEAPFHASLLLQLSAPLPPATAGASPGLSAGLGRALLQQQHQQQLTELQQIQLLQARRSMGPSSHSATATPSSPTQS